MAALQFGVSLRGTDIDHVTAIEALGFDSVWTGEHMLFHGPVTDGLITLAAFAGKSSRLTIGSAINLLPLRPPVVVAKAVSTLDVVSKGRFIFGVGVGGEFPKEFEACGVPHHERGQRANEAIEICRKLWTEDHVSSPLRISSNATAHWAPRRNALSAYSALSMPGYATSSCPLSAITRCWGSTWKSTPGRSSPSFAEAMEPKINTD
jgi:alkanesulfonate monooxygenase SsuD/methylene tetrahydromethanopterin reductase-like flavin-dependent oxidoreductase (luciferase family)